MIRYGRGYTNGSIRQAMAYAQNAAEQNGKSAGVNEIMPLVENLEAAALMNENFRTLKWKGRNMLMTVMDIPAGGEIGSEVHEKSDQFIYIVRGNGIVMIGKDDNNTDIKQNISDGYGIIIPMGSKHNLFNTGNGPLKLISVYAPTADA